MDGRWITQQGDEWEFSGQTVSARADRYADDCLFVIRSIYKPTGALDDRSVMHVLKTAAQLFPEYYLLVKLRPHQNDVQAILMSLQEQRLLTCAKIPQHAVRFEFLRGAMPETWCRVEVTSLA